MIARTLIAALAGAALASTATAQAIDSRITAVRDGTVRLTFAARPGVLGNGPDHIQWDCGQGGCRRDIGTHREDPDVEWNTACDSGPVRLTLRVRSGSVTDLRLAVGGRWVPRTDVTDLGAVPAAAVVRYLLTLARRGGRVGTRAIFASTLADSVTVWPDLLRLARDGSLTTETRRQAVFWVSQAAGSAATKGLDELVGEDTVDREVRE
jgi:hypothetical protein